MKVRTGISALMSDDMVLRGEKHSGLVKSAPFSDAVFLTLSGRKPRGPESRLFGAMLTAIIDHGAGTPSAIAARVVMSTGNPLQAAVAGGILALGEYHGGAIEGAMRQLREHEGKEPRLVVRELLSRKKHLFGFGHKVYKEEDPRVRVLLGLCEELGFSSRYLDFALSLERALEEEKGRRLVLNIDGFIAAALLEMGFSPEAGKGLFLIGRVPGLVAHAVEEREREKPVRRLDETAITYDGRGG